MLNKTVKNIPAISQRYVVLVDKIQITLKDKHYNTSKTKSLQNLSSTDSVFFFCLKLEKVKEKLLLHNFLRNFSSKMLFDDEVKDPSSLSLL